MGVPIVGRNAELAQLRAALVAASGGAGRLVLVSGEPGIGKTRLVSALTEMAGEYDVPVAVGRAVDDPGMPPLWPWQETGRSVPALAGALDGAAGSAGRSSDAAADSAAARFMMFATACQALGDAAADRGLLVVLEDLQWADRSSLLFLRHLAGELQHSRVLVVATFRETTDTPLAGLLPALLQAGDARSIRVTGLAPPDIAQWLRLLGTSGDVDYLAGRLWAGTGGNPLFVRMIAERGTLAASDELSGTPELRRLVLARCDRLGEPARDLLGAASVLGERIDPPVLAEVAGLAPAPAGALLDQAVAEGVRSRTLLSGTRCMTSCPRRGGWPCTSGPPVRWRGPGAARPSPGRSPVTGRGLVLRTGRRTACAGLARRPGRRRHRSPTTRRPGSPRSRSTRPRRTSRGRTPACAPS